MIQYTKIILFFLILLRFLTLEFNIKAQSVIEENGKQGIIDDNGKVILPPKYEVVKYYPRRLEDFFIIRQNYKYAYAYKVTYSVEYDSRNDKESYKKIDNPYWIISDFEFDAINPFFGYSNYGWRHIRGVVIKYKKNGEWGLMYLEAVTDSRHRLFTEPYYKFLGSLTIYPPLYDKIFPINETIIPVKKGEKYGFVLLYRNYDYSDSTVYKFYTEPQFDERPKRLTHENNQIYLNVNKNGKHGLIRVAYDDGNYEELIPCECFSEFDWVSPKLSFICQDNIENKLILYEVERNLILEFKSLGNNLRAIRTTISHELNNKETEQEKEYLILHNTSKSTGNKITEVHILDFESEKFIYSQHNQKDVSYDIDYLYDYGIIIKQTRISGNQFKREFHDIEMGKVVFSLPPEKDSSYHYYFNSSESERYIFITYFKLEEKTNKYFQKTYKNTKEQFSYYDKITKTYTKGKNKEWRRKNK